MFAREYMFGWLKWSKHAQKRSTRKRRKKFVHPMRANYPSLNKKKFHNSFKNMQVF